MDNFSVVFRCDASLQIGTGHVMRCLTLAEALKANGAACHFLCRVLDGNLIQRIRSRGFPVSEINSNSEPDELIGYQKWIGSTEARDAQECQCLLENLRPGLVIIDNYALGSAWVDIAVNKECEVLFIDDLANRKLDCQFLLNQNLGTSAEQYETLLKSGTVKLLGPTYALLRPEFSMARQKALNRKRDTLPSRLLIAFGGTDESNATLKALECLHNATIRGLSEIVVVLDIHAPHLDSVRDAAKQMHIPTRVLSGVTRMDEVLLDVDLALGAAGSSVWERCALGIPSLLLTLADNQKSGSLALADAGAGIHLGSIEDQNWKPRLVSTLGKALETDCWQALCAKAAAVCDGQGTQRVVSTLMDKRLTLRPASIQDASLIWTWRHQGDASRYYKNTSLIPLPDHLRWFQNALIETNRRLLVAQVGTVPIAHLRFDIGQEGANSAEIGICIDADFRGRGYGRKLLRLGIEYAKQLGMKNLTAEIHRHNVASLTIFSGVGFLETSSHGDFLTLTLSL